MSMKEKIMPPLVLTLICVITSALLVAAYNITGNEFYIPFMWLFYAPSQYIIAHFSKVLLPEHK